MQIIVGQFNDSYPPVIDGVANTVQNYAYWINKKYGKSYVVTPKYPHYKDKDDFEVIRYASTQLPFRAPYRLGIPSIALYSKLKLNHINFDLVHVHCPFSSGHLALKLAKKKNIPIIATFHSKFYDDYKQVFKNEFLTHLMLKRTIQFFHQVDYVWTVNKRTAETLKDYGYHKEIEIMPNGTDLMDDKINIDYLNHFMYHHFRIKENDLVFLYVGQHIWQKNIKLIVEALNLIKDKVSFKMFFIGDGYAKKQLQCLIDKYHLNSHVFLLGKILDRQILKQFYARADLFIFPSVYDNAPLVVREAAALKTPSIVIEGSNAQEGIIDCDNGFTCLNDVFSLANKIQTAVTDLNLLKQIGENAQNTIASSWEFIVEKVLDRYQEIIENYHKNRKIL